MCRGVNVIGTDNTHVARGREEKLIALSELHKDGSTGRVRRATAALGGGISFSLFTLSSMLSDRPTSSIGNGIERINQHILSHSVELWQFSR
jgi:hypothetical protein